MIINKYFTGYLALVCLLSACSKNEAYDIKGDPDVKFFVNSPGAGNAPQNSISYNVVNIPDAAGEGLINLSATIPGSINFPVFSTKPVAEETMIGAELDNSLIAQYNEANNTNYTAFPAGVINTDGLAAHFLKGATESADSITITSNPEAFNKLTEKTYMAPVRLTSVSSGSAGKLTSSSTLQVVYMVANVELRRIKYLAAEDDALGALITPRTSWMATFNPLPSVSGSVLDGSTTTYTRWTASPGQIDVDMQSARNVTGIRIYTATSATYIPSQIEVSLSNDGIDYDVIGSPLKANLTYASRYSYILFYKAIPARYIRLKMNYVSSTNSQNYRIVEFDVYAN